MFARDEKLIVSARMAGQIDQTVMQLTQVNLDVGKPRISLPTPTC